MDYQSIALTTRPTTLRIGWSDTPRTGWSDTLYIGRSDTLRIGWSDTIHIVWSDTLRIGWSELAGVTPLALVLPFSKFHSVPVEPIANHSKFITDKNGKLNLRVTPLPLPQTYHFH